MKKIFSILSLTIILCTNIFSQEANVVPGEVLIMLKHNASINSVVNNLKGIGLTMKEPVVEWMNIWLCEYNQNTQPNAALSIIRSNPDVAVAQFNHYVTERSSNEYAILPNDPSFGQQWSLNNTGQNGGTPDADIDGPEAWNLTTSGLTAMGDSIIVSIVDGGAYLTHPDLKFWKNWFEIPANNIDDDLNGYIDDVNGWNAISQTGTISSNTHGSHCSGIAGALSDNNLGISSINWNIKIMAVVGSSGTEAVVVRAYGYVLKQRKIYDQTNGLRGAFVVSTNSSFGVNYGQPVNYPLWCAFYDSLGAAGILNACATANLNVNVDVVGDIPTACPSPWMVSVTNTTNTDVKNSGAAYGLITIDLGAPGTSIYSTTTSGNYGNLTGTSMATPHVAGAIAFMYAVAPVSFIQSYKTNPGPTSLIVKDKILQGVDPKPTLTGFTVSGGRLNIHNSGILMQNPTGTLGNQNEIPKQFRLYMNYPNPFNPTTLIKFDIPKIGFVSLKIFNILGVEVAVLENGIVQAGVHQKVFDASNLPSGVYFYKLGAGDFSETRKMTLIK